MTHSIRIGPGLLITIIYCLFSLHAFSQNNGRKLIDKTYSLKFQKDLVSVSSNNGTTEILFPETNIDQEKIGADFWFYLKWEELKALEEDFSFFYRYSADNSDWSSWFKATHFEDTEGNVAGIKSSGCDFFDIDANYLQIKIRYENNFMDDLFGVLKNIDLRIYNFEKADVTIKKVSNDNLKMGGGCSCPMPDYVDRSEWGCPDGDGPSCDPPSYTTVTHLIVHHEAGSNTEPGGGWDDRVYGIWVLHTDGVYCDIAYNWLIDHDGVVYEGRGGGDDVLGAHMCSANSGTMGVCILGNMSLIPVPAAAENSLIDLLSWKACEKGIDPLGSTFHVDPSPGNLLENIAGHKDGCAVGYTECPGTFLYADLDDIRDAVNDCVDGGGGGGSGPDIIISDASLSDYSVTCGDVITVDVTGENIGDESMETPNVSYYFSTDCTIGDGDEIGLGTDDFSTLDPGDTDDESASVTVPEGFSDGTYYILLLADYTDDFDETNEDNNITCVSFEYTCDGGGTADLEITDVTLSDYSVNCEDVITVDVIGENIGGSSMTTPSVAYYFSTDCTWGDGDEILLDTDDFGTLDAGDDDDETANVTIPSGYPDGTYYIMAVGDYTEDFDEDNESNNIFCVEIDYTCEIVDPGIDLAITNLTLSVYSVGCEDVITADVIGENMGGETLTTPSVGYYFSADCTWGDGDDVLLDTDDFGSIDPGDTDDESATITIPAGYAGGTYYIMAVGDYTGEFSEDNESNNILCSAEIEYTCIDDITDLKIEFLSVVPAVFELGTSIDITVRITNLGSEIISEYNHAIYESGNDCDLSFEVDDDLFASGTTFSPDLNPGDYYDKVINDIILGGPAGTYYLKARTDKDDELLETDEINNFDCFEITILSPDVVDIGVINLTTPESGCGMTEETITATIQNFGSTTVTSFPIKYKVDTDPSVTETAFLTLTPGATGNYSFSTDYDFSMPNIYSIDVWTTLATDDNAANNHFISDIESYETPVVELGPAITSCDFAFLDAGNPGSEFLWSTGETTQTISVTVTGTYSVTVTSPDGECSDSDNISVTINHTAIASFTSITDGLEVTFTNTSNYATSYFWNFGDFSTSTESDPIHTYATEGDNTVTLTATNTCGSDSYSSILTVSGDETVLPDLTVSINSVASPAIIGENFDVEFTVQNMGDASAAACQVAFYLTEDCFGNDFQYLTTKDVTALTPGSSTTFSTLVPIPVDADEGSSYLWAYVDFSEAIDESSESNNTACELVNLLPPINGINDEGVDFIKIYPNPTYGNLLIEIPGNSICSEFTVTNVLGQNLNRVMNLTSHANIIELNLEIYPSGIYFINFYLNGKIYSEKVNLIH